MAYDLEHFRRLFLDEAADHLAAMEQGLLALEAGADDPELVHAVFRAAHSIKGGAGSVGFIAVAEFTHRVEGVLGRVRDGVLAPEPILIALLVRATDAIRRLVDDPNAADDAPEQSSIAAELQSVLDASSKPAAADTAPTPEATIGAAARELTIKFAPHERFFHTGQDPLLLLGELIDLAEKIDVRVDSTRLPLLGALDPHTCYLSWTIRLRTVATAADLLAVFAFADGDCDLEIGPAVEIQAAAEPAAPRVATVPSATDAAAATSIRVAASKVDALVDLVGEMIISQSMLNQLAVALPSDRAGTFRDALSALDRQTRDLQERVMAVRMLPVDTIFSRFVRLIRDLSAQLGKRVRLEMSGVDTELDKGMLERLVDPLVHLLRNAIDHGIESPEERRAAGKPEEGTVTLRAFHESGGVVIEVGDDGRGLDTRRIREKALALGLLTNERATDDEIHALIFAPGFSTAHEVSDVSGRGVGMDVVKRTVDALKGSISVNSTPRVGNRIRVRLPLTLAVLDGFVVRVAGDAFVMPISTIVESLRPAPQDIRDLLGRGETIELRGATIPFIRLATVFGLYGGTTEPGLGIVVVCESEGKRFGVLVDEVVGEQQVVIKSLEKNFRRVDGAMAATILGDGRVALIIDVPQLCALTAAHARRLATPTLIGA